MMEYTRHKWLDGMHQNCSQNIDNTGSKENENLSETFVRPQWREKGKNGKEKIRVSKS